MAVGCRSRLEKESLAIIGNSIQKSQILHLVSKFVKKVHNSYSDFFITKFIPFSIFAYYFLRLMVPIFNSNFVIQK